MAQQCELTGKKPQMGNNVSHANNKTRAKWHLNLKKKRYFVPELKRFVTLNLSTRAIRTIDKLGGLSEAIFKAKDTGLSKQALKIKKDIQKTRTKKVAAA